MSLLRLSPATIGPVFAIIAASLFSMNDAMMKFLSGNYALHELVMIRSVVGMAFVLGVMVPLSGSVRVLRTKRLTLHMVRAAFVVFANLTFFLGLAALPLADNVAIFFITPFLITIASVIFLGESVGLRRWSAIGFGLLGVLIIVRPGTSAFQIASLFPLAAAFGYAGLHIMTRYLRDTENAVSMTFYIQVFFLIVCAAFGLAIGDGKFAGSDNASLEFLFRAWTWPETTDLWFMVMLGLFASTGGYCISQAYRLGEAALVAPFEYLSLPLGIVLGILVFGTWPDPIAWAGIALILSSGLYTVWRENQIKQQTERNVRTGG